MGQRNPPHSTHNKQRNMRSISKYRRYKVRLLGNQAAFVKRKQTKGKAQHSLRSHFIINNAQAGDPLLSPKQPRERGYPRCQLNTPTVKCVYKRLTEMILSLRVQVDLRKFVLTTGTADTHSFQLDPTSLTQITWPQMFTMLVTWLLRVHSACAKRLAGAKQRSVRKTEHGLVTVWKHFAQMKIECFTIDNS